MSVFTTETPVLDHIGFYTLDGNYHVDTVHPSPTPEALAFKERRRALMTMGDAARLLGISVSEVSDLEHGRRTCDWAKALEMLEARNGPTSARKEGT